MPSDVWHALYEIHKDEKAEIHVRYVESPLDCLAGYLLERIQLLLHLNKLVEEVKKDFGEKWSAGQFPGWRIDTGSAMARQCNGQALWGHAGSHNILFTTGADVSVSGSAEVSFHGACAQVWRDTV